MSTQPVRSEAWGPSCRYRVEAAGRTHVGRRAHNEDAMLLDEELGVFVVADGMGGYEGGEVASQVVVETVRRFFADNAGDAELTWPWGFEPGRSFVTNLLTVALRLANREVRARRRGRLASMGATAVAAAVDGARVIVAHVGDSRVYRLRGGTLEPLTRDHSLREQLRALGAQEIPEGISHVITRAIGMGDEEEPDLRVESLAPGDTLLLCSDGLSDPLDDARLRELLAHADVEQAAEGLGRAAYAAGGTDNITALVIRFR